MFIWTGATFALGNQHWVVIVKSVLVIMFVRVFSCVFVLAVEQMHSFVNLHPGSKQINNYRQKVKSVGFH